MALIIVGLGNPGEEYVHTRHNVGRDLLVAIAKKEGIDMWKHDKSLRSLVAKGDFFGDAARLILPETYMNNSGGAVKPLIDSKKKLEKLVVIHDDLDLPLGKVKVSVGSGAGGHRGVASIQKALKSKDFARIRIGICPATPSGKPKKPDARKVVDFVIGKFKKPEEETLKKVKKMVSEALEHFADGGVARAMNVINAR